jgi:hypothetical protein
MMQLVFMTCILFSPFAIAQEGSQPDEMLPHATAVRYPFVYQKSRTMLVEFFDDLHSGKRYVTEEQFKDRVNQLGYDFGNIWDLEHYFYASATATIRECSWTGHVPEGVTLEYVTDEYGSGFGEWDRSGSLPCNEGEYIVYDNDRPIFSLYCGNVIHAPMPIVAAAPVVTEEKPTQELAQTEVQSLGLKEAPVPSARERCRTVYIPQQGGRTIFIPFSNVFPGGMDVNVSHGATLMRKECE